MRKNLLEFLFGDVAAPTKSDDLGEDIVKFFEDADELEAVEMVANKKPLGDALSSIGISSKVEPGYQMAEVRFSDANEYREADRLLSDPENVHKLAELGWVCTREGDIAQTNEPAEYKLNFVEISVASDLSNKDKAPDLEKVLKQGQEFAAKPVDRDDEMNPVENTRSDKKGEKQAGIGKAKDGDEPEGKPKGSTKKTESRTARELTNKMLESQSLDEHTPSANLGSKKKQAPYFRTDKNLGKKKKVTETTMAAAIPPVESPMATGKTWRERLDQMRKRRDPEGKEKHDDE
jgi:hypothetical protein